MGSLEQPAQVQRMRILDLPIKLIVSPLCHSNTADHMFRNGVNQGQHQIIAERLTNPRSASYLGQSRALLEDFVKLSLLIDGFRKFIGTIRPINAIWIYRS
jgi:hypothetical protein